MNLTGPLLVSTHSVSLITPTWTSGSERQINKHERRQRVCAGCENMNVQQSRRQRFNLRHKMFLLRTFRGVDSWTSGERNTWGQKTSSVASTWTDQSQTFRKTDGKTHKHTAMILSVWTWRGVSSAESLLTSQTAHSLIGSRGCDITTWLCSWRQAPPPARTRSPRTLASSSPLSR